MFVVMEINFCRRHGAPGGGKGNGGGLERVWHGLGFSAEVANQISLMKWKKYDQTDRVGKEGHPCPFFLKLPSMAISPLGIDHFINEITDCTQQQKIPAHARPVPGRRRFLSRSPARHAFCEN